MQRDSQKAFQCTHLHYLPWIYCSNHSKQKCGIFTINFIRGVKVYNYSKYVWLNYSMCALRLHDISHAISNAHLVSKAGSVINGNFHHVQSHVQYQPRFEQLVS